MDSDRSYGKDDVSDKDRLLLDYDSVVRESALLTTFTGILFGFLLRISIDSANEFSLVNRITILVAIFSITVAISLFVLPVIYHHLQYPYADLEKFKRRAHKFMIFGFVPMGVTLYLCLELSLSSLLSEFAFILAAIPFLLVYILFPKRK
jgi:Family of unknown function (DUF6328)